MTKAAKQAKEHVVSLIRDKKIINLGHIFSVGKYSQFAIYKELGVSKIRFAYLLYNPQYLTCRDIRLIAYHFNLHFLVIQMLVDRQLEDQNYKVRKYIAPPIQNQKARVETQASNN